MVEEVHSVGRSRVIGHKSDNLNEYLDWSPVCINLVDSVYRAIEDIINDVVEDHVC